MIFHSVLETFYGCKKSEVFGRDNDGALQEVTWKEVMNAIKNVLAGALTFGFENRVRVLNGSRRTCFWKVEYLLDDEVNSLDAIGVMVRLYEQIISMFLNDSVIGYSTSSDLKQFNVYKLTIDQSFISVIAVDIEGKAIITAIINMAINLGRQAIAVGFGSVGKLAFLRLLGLQSARILL